MYVGEILLTIQLNDVFLLYTYFHILCVSVIYHSEQIAYYRCELCRTMQ